VENDLGEHRPALIIASCVAVVSGLVLVWIFGLEGRDEMASPLTNLSEITDSAAIQNHVVLSRISIATGENYFGHKVRFIYGLLKNVSDKPLRVVDVRMVFTDYDGNPIQESIQKAFENHSKPLTPGNEYRFEVGFENLPPTWNYRIPVTTVVKIAY
jgi:hypothetical protein